VIVPESPPGFVVRTEARKAAASNGYRLERGIEGSWLRYASTTAQSEIWIASASSTGPWFLSVDRPDIAAEIGVPAALDIAGPGAAAFAFDALAGLYAALDRVWRLGLSLPDAPLTRWRATTRNLPLTTEAERLVVQRIGQDLFREALIEYWGGRCPLTGIADRALLRASHIVPWAECTSDEQRLDVHNGLLLSALWDAAFDTGLVGFSDDGSVLPSPALSPAARAALSLDAIAPLAPLTSAHRRNLAYHRKRFGL